MTKVRGTGESVQMDEDWFVRRDGSMFPVSYTSTPIDMADGPGVVVAFKDIEEQREAEQALREREAILATVGQPVWVTDFHGRFHYANPAALAALGFDEALRARGQARPRHGPLQVPRRDAVPRGGLPARPGAQGGGDAAGHRGLARAQGRLDRARHLLVGAVRAARRPGLGDRVQRRGGAAPGRAGGARARRRPGAGAGAAGRAAADHRGRRRGAGAARARPARRRAAAVRQRDARSCSWPSAGRRRIRTARASCARRRSSWRAPALHRAAPARRRDPSRRSSPTAGSARRWSRSPRGCRCPCRSSRRRRSGCRRPVEASVYFFVSEALTNVVKHAQAHEATVRIGAVERRADGRGHATTAWAARRTPAAAACAGSATASAPSTGRSRSRARRAAGRSCGRPSHCAVRRSDRSSRGDRRSTHRLPVGPPRG